MRVIPFLFLLVTGCMGQIGSNPGGDDDTTPGSAKQIFVSEVHPILSRCSGGTCHSTDGTSTAMVRFYSPNANTTYGVITAAPLTVGEFNSISPILTKIDAGHQNVSYTAGERTSILDWLAAEADERTPVNQPPPVDPTELLKAWSGCMTQANFDTAQMADKFGNSNALNGQACKNCHGSSAFGFTVSPDSTPYFTVISTSLSQMLKYFSVQQGAVIINMAAITNAGTAIVDHPQFDPANLPGFDAVQSFYDLTKTAQMAGGCGPSTLINP